MDRRQDWQKDEDKHPRDDDDAAPSSTREELAERLVRIDGDVNGKWRACPAGACRRHRACSAPGVPCWDPAAVAGQLHDDNPRIRGAARLMSSYRGAR
jgi:hypothetical protein